MTSNIGRKRTQGLWNNCSNDGGHMQSRGRRRPKWGNDFSVRWDKICDVPFDRTNFIRNTLNEGKPVKYSRDGQRLTTDAGVQLTALIDRITAKEGMGSAIIRKPVAIHSGEVAFQKVFVDGRLEIASSTPMASAIAAATAAATAAAAAAGSRSKLMDAAAASGGEMAQRLLLAQAQMTNPFAVISTGNGLAVNTGLLGAAATGVRAAHGEAAANGRRKSRSSSHTRSTSWRRRRQRRVGGGRNRYGNGGDERRRRGSDGRRGERSRDGDRDRRRDRGRDRDKRRRRSESHSRSRSRRRRGQRY